MKTTAKRLKTLFYICIAFELLLIVLYESNVLLEGAWTGNAEAEFLVMTLMQLVTVCAIPLALRLMKFSAVRQYITSHGIPGLLHISVLRQLMLFVPMFLNSVFYYEFVKAGFGYLAIILAISLVFIVPTQSRCASEL